MSKDGTYGKRKRQRYRCTDQATKTFHRFVPELPRLVVASWTCDTCDNHVHTHQGSVVLPGGLYEVREIAQALVLLAQGQTHTETARVIRGRYWGVGGTGRRSANSVESGQTVADWLDQFGPVISAGTTEAERPETIVVDSTEFQHTDDIAKWAGLIRADLESNGGKPSNPRRLVDPIAQDSAGDRI